MGKKEKPQDQAGVEKKPAVPRGPVEVIPEVIELAPEPVQKLIQQLEEARAEGDKGKQKKLRRMLRKKQFYLSKQEEAVERWLEKAPEAKESSQ